MHGEFSGVIANIFIDKSLWALYEEQGIRNIDYIKLINKYIIFNWIKYVAQKAPRSPPESVFYLLDSN